MIMKVRVGSKKIIRTTPCLDGMVAVEGYAVNLRDFDIDGEWLLTRGPYGHTDMWYIKHVESGSSLAQGPTKGYTIARATEIIGSHRADKINALFHTATISAREALANM